MIAVKNEDPIEIDDSNDEDDDDKQLDVLTDTQNGKTIQTNANGPFKMVEIRIQLDRCDADHRNNAILNGNAVNSSAEVNDLNDADELDKSGSLSRQAIPANINKDAVGRNVVKLHKCALCDFATRHLHGLKRHKRIHTNKKLVGTKADSNGLYHCTHCIRKFSDFGALSKHSKSHDDNQHLYHCARCMRRFVQEAKRNKHERQCEGRYFECHLCKVFVARTEVHMQCHMRAHSGAKPFRCMVCDKCFQTGSSLRRHLNTIHSRDDV